MDKERYLKFGWLHHLISDRDKFDEESVKSGISWAMENPDWRLFCDERPDEKGEYLCWNNSGYQVLTWNGGSFGKTTYDDVFGGLHREKVGVIAWMEVPKISERIERLFNWK